MTPKQIKSKQRVADHGEVFTAEREVKAMCDLVDQETQRIDSRFLEPACGDGNFLREILLRKLSKVKRDYKRSPYDYERNSLLAIGSIYGVDILLDNAITCRERLYNIWDNEYKTVCKKECNDDTRRSAKFILKRNIVCGNALSLRCVDEYGKDTNEPIVFSQWALITGPQMNRKDYSFDELLNGKTPHPKGINNKDQLTLFEESQQTDEDGKFLKEYTSHYRRVWENDTL